MKETLHLFLSCPLQILQINNCTSYVEEQRTFIELRSSYYHGVGEIIDSNYTETWLDPKWYCKSLMGLYPPFNFSKLVYFSWRYHKKEKRKFKKYITKTRVRDKAIIFSFQKGSPNLKTADIYGSELWARQLK